MLLLDEHVTQMVSPILSDDTNNPTIMPQDKVHVTANDKGFIPLPKK